MSRKHCILFLINSLAAGGAERQLSQLVRGMDRERFEVHIAVFYDPGDGHRGELWPEVAATPGVTLHSLHKRPGPLGYLKALPRFFNLAWQLNPAVLHGYLQGNLTVLLVGSLLRKPTVWGIRRTSNDLSKFDRRSMVGLRLEVWLSRFADLIIFNSQSGARNYQGMGMRAKRMQVIPNGYNVSLFAPDRARGLAMRRAWGIPEDAPLIGLAGRLVPVKDHPTFLRTAARLLETWPSAWFVCVGEGDPAYLHFLQAMTQSLGLGDRVRWVGGCRDMAAAYNAMSVMVLSSSDEGFPNVLGEAMACGVPCVATPAGDAPILLGETGPVCPFRDDRALAGAVSQLLAEGPEAHAARTAACRTRITDHYSLEALTRGTEEAMVALLPPEGRQDTSDGGPLTTAFPGGARYLLRFDDICPTMDWSLWNPVEDLLAAQGVKPIVAVIPDNRDPSLMISPPAPDFWDRVRGWQARGWGIGLHGYQHLAVNSESGILGFPTKSEFAGLPYEEQRRKLRLGLDIFAREGVRPDVWIAPSHSFDLVTVAALRDLGVHAISDGMALSPYRDGHGTLWIPQQFALMRPMPRGVWTFCYHATYFAEGGMATFRKRLELLRPGMISLAEAMALGDRRRSMLDSAIGLTRKTLTLVRKHRARWAS
jgi:glycosyltransferase involved in cell wall biosynthesis